MIVTRLAINDTIDELQQIIAEDVVDAGAFRAAAATVRSAFIFPVLGIQNAVAVEQLESVRSVSAKELEKGVISSVYSAGRSGHADEQGDLCFSLDQYL